MQPAGRELLAALAAVLNRWGRWYLFGAQAVVAYGVPRLSADVDVTLRLAPDEPDRFVGDMRVRACDQGSRLRAGDTRHAVRSHRNGNAA